MEELFDRKKIAINRAGRLTEEQQALLKADTNPFIWLTMAGVLLLIGAMFGALFSSPESDGSLRALILGIVGLCLLFSIWRGTRLLIIRSKLLSNELLAETGTVSIKKLDALDQLRYSPETDAGLRLYPGGLAGLSANLPPGRYRFYYLPTQRWLLSAEPLSSLEELTRNYNEILARFFKYSPEDLVKYREMVRTGQLLVADGQFSLVIKPHLTEVPEEFLPDEVLVGNTTFFVDHEIPGIILSGLSHRFYYSPTPSDGSLRVGARNPRPLAAEVLLNNPPRS